MSMDEKGRVIVKEEMVLQKFEGEPLPENEIERIYIVDGRITAHEHRNGEEVLSREEFDA